jgi:hypothetical protein
MPKNQVSDPITDQEIAFAHLVLSGTMTDHRAAEAVGLNPDTAVYTKAKPRVRAYMLEHRAAVQQQLVQQDADLCRRAVEGQHRLNLDREQVLNRLWEIANLSPDMTRNSITGQVKALTMIVAIQGLIPGRRTVSAQSESAPPQIVTAAWLREQQGKTTVPQPSPDLDQDGRIVPDPPPGAAADAPSDLGPAPDRTLDSSDPIFVHPSSPSGTTPSSPHARMPDSAADNRVPSSREKNPFTWRLRL